MWKATITCFEDKYLFVFLMLHFIFPLGNQAAKTKIKSGFRCHETVTMQLKTSFGILLCTTRYEVWCGGEEESSLLHNSCLELPYFSR